MKITDYLDKDKDRLLTELSAAHSPEKAVVILENETDKLLLKHNEQCSSERERETAAYIMQAVRLSLPLIDSAGRTKVWEHTSSNDYDQESKASVPAILLLIAGLGLMVYGLIPLVLAGIANSDAATRNEVIIRCSSILSGLIASFIAGILFRRPAKASASEHHVEIRVDPDKIYRSYRTVILSVEQSLEDISAKERWEQKEQAGTIDGRPASTPEIDLFSDLIAASYSGDPEFALEKLEEVKYYLHKQQIDVVEYSEATKNYFDMMPGAKKGTIRPALVAEGGILKKGLASSGR